MHYVDQYSMMYVCVCVRLDECVYNACLCMHRSAAAGEMERERMLITSIKINTNICFRDKNRQALGRYESLDKVWLK